MRMPELLPGAGHLLCRHAEGRGTGVSANPAIDTYAKLGFAKLYHRKTPITAADALNDRVLPFFEEHGISVSRALTGRGTEYCGRPAVENCHE